MLGKGERETGTGRPAEAGAPAVIVAGREMRWDRGEMPRRSVCTPVLRGLVSSAPLQFGATRGLYTPPSSGKLPLRIENLQFGPTRGTGTLPIFARGTGRGAQREKEGRASPAFGRNSGNRGGRDYAPGAGSHGNPGRSMSSLAGMLTGLCSRTHRGTTRLSGTGLWRAPGTRQPIGVGCWEICVRFHSAERRRGNA